METDHGISGSLPQLFDLSNSTLKTTSHVAGEKTISVDQCRNCQTDSSYSQTNIGCNRNNWKLFVILYHAKNFVEGYIKLFLHGTFGFG